jgi:[ribosomal protein S5]-alanine N-acetyltransferase
MPRPVTPAGTIRLVVTLETPRLLLCQVDYADLDDFTRLHADPAVTAFIGDGKPADRPETEARLNEALAHWQEHGFGTFTLRLRGSGGFVGRAGLVVQQLDSGAEVEVGYALATEYRYQGYATEAASAVRDHGIDDLGFRRLISLIDVENEASRRVATRLGMGFERQVSFGARWQVLGLMSDLFALDVC